MNLRTLLEGKAFKYSGMAFGALMALSVLYVLGAPIAKEFSHSFAAKEFKQHGILKTYQNHYQIFSEKVFELADADIHHNELMNKLGQLQKELEVTKMKNAELEGSKDTKNFAHKIHVESGSSVAHIPDGIEYEIPLNLAPHQMLSLGMSYFRNDQFEKSAVIFHELVHLKEERGFQRADNYMIAAISWYKIKHYEMAHEYLKLAQKKTESGSELYRQTILWQAMIENARGNRKAAQGSLAQLISLYPQSKEVEWINGGRAPASKKSLKKEVHHEEVKHEEVKHEEVHHDEHGEGAHHE